jgi:hypothetical protein
MVRFTLPENRALRVRGTATPEPSSGTSAPASRPGYEEVR